ncbi:MAG: urease accessory protein UreD [Bacteroidota bacterium]|nr:urease accessory protein UreD [Bacteroidota bacterium]
MQIKNHLHIKAACKNNKTYLHESYHRQPFKLANITEDKAGSLLRLMITSSSPGILDNDSYNIEIEILENAKLHLTTQGYQRIFTMSNKASQHINVKLENMGAFYFLPHPNVPHKASSFSSVNNIYLHKNHDLLWSEIITCGRKLSGEEFQFTRYHCTANIYLENKLIVKENILLEPIKKDVHSLGQLEGYTHQSSLLFINDEADMKECANVCRKILSGNEGIVFGISLLPLNGLIFRILGHHGEQLFDCNRKLASVIQQLKKRFNLNNSV